MRGKVLYRIACGTCGVCLTYGIIMQALRGEDPAQTAAAEWVTAPAAVVAEAVSESAAVPAAEPAAVPSAEYGGGQDRKSRGSWGGESGNGYAGFGGRGGRGRYGLNGSENASGIDQEANAAASFREQAQETESASAEEEQDTGSTVQENRAADNPPTLNEFLSAFRCGGCRHNCSLLNPRCMKGRTKKQNATVQYQETYGG